MNNPLYIAAVFLFMGWLMMLFIGIIHSFVPAVETLGYVPSVGLAIVSRLLYATVCHK